MTRSARWILTAAVSTMLLAGCGGSDSPETVGGCVIEAGTQCSGADLSGADLSGADLSRADLSGANLEGTNLSGSNLSEADLSGARTIGTDLSDADLTRANLTGATITGTNLDGAILCGTTRTDGTTDDTGCPASTDTTDTTDTTETTGDSDAAEVTSFDVGDLDCSAGGADGMVDVTWETDNATAVEIAVDSGTASGLGPSGSTNVSVPCDGAQHQITITPLSDSGAGEPETEDVGP